jgi:4-aminobutyrate aminotransferase/(S)-3-amino-2-methylpropionate transaminase
MGVGGIVVPPPEFHDTIKEICSQNDILVIHDEVYCGMGRTGKVLASEHWNLQPNIVTVAKGLGGGYPIVAVATTDEIALSAEPGDVGGTLAGSPLACAAGAVTLRILKKENVLQNAEKMGVIFLEEFQKLEQSPFVGDVRGLGLSIGIELVKDKKSKKPAVEETRKVVANLRNDGILISAAGARAKNVLRLNPPLTIGEEDVKRSIDLIQKHVRAL